MLDKIQNLTNNDAVRMEEQMHEKELKKKLQEFGIDYTVGDIRPFGIRLRQQKNKTIFSKH
jgi:hypothetical protein